MFNIVQAAPELTLGLMDWMTFVVELVKAVAWPAVAIVVIVVFKDKLTKLFEEITELKALGIEAKFARRARAALAEVEIIEAAEQLPPGPPVEEPFDPNAPVDDPLLPRISPVSNLIAAGDPKGAVLLARTNIDAAVKRLSVREGTMVKGRINTRSVLYALANDGVISKEVLQTALDLIALGNKAAHGDFEPDVSSALDFVHASDKLVRLLLRPHKSLNREEP